jgi:hypothetical protein
MPDSALARATHVEFAAHAADTDDEDDSPLNTHGVALGKGLA